MDKLLSHNAKRKKRKTRKCLDEIRKRSRSVSVVNDLSKKKSKPLDLNGLNNGRKSNNNNCITSKRLTLTMFAKAIRSETVTRPLLGDRKDFNLVVNTKSPASSPLNIIVEKSSGNGSATNMSDEKDIPYKKSDFEKYENHNDENSSTSIILFSPPNRQVVERHRLPEATSENSISTVTSTSAANEEFGDHLHDELIDDISLYVRRNLSNLIKDDPMRKTKTFLKSLYIENVTQQHEGYKSVARRCVNTIDKHLYTIPKEVIVQNPMDYIKIGWRQGRRSNRTSDSLPSEDDASPPRSPTAPTQIPSIITYTPDYAFYPHRLNE